MAQRTDLSTTRNLGWALAVVLRRWHEGVEDVLKDVPQGSRGYQVLSTVVHEQLPTQVALAAHLSIDRTVMTYLIDELEGDGLVERRPDPADRRARRIVATARGRKVLAAAERRVAAVEDVILSGLSADEQAAFQDLTQRAATHIHHEDPNADPCTAVRQVFDQAN
ncbi:MarR family transcriptional regulator [Actinocrispum sp. NPDC049592]|uniref:MarR family winged helix-turn-helix transcriptional regulator n=1 Tax=Actinocrispum sp. NPDC049592 TaxID=3154835 RepID=UPI003438F6D6